MFKQISDRYTQEQKEVNANASTMYGLTKYGIIGTLGGAIMGFISGFPLEAIATLALTGGCVMGSVNAALDTQYKSTRLQYEAANLKKLANQKIDTSSAAMEKRKNRLSLLGKKLEQRKAEKATASGINKILNFGLLATAFMGMVTPGPLCAIPVGISILKFFQNKTLNVRKHDYEAVLSQYHQLEDEINIAQDLNNKQNNYRGKVEAKKQVEQKTYAKQKETPVARTQNNYNNIYYTGYANANTKGAYQKVRV